MTHRFVCALLLAAALVPWLATGCNANPQPAEPVAPRAGDAPSEYDFSTSDGRRAWVQAHVSRPKTYRVLDPPLNARIVQYQAEMSSGEPGWHTRGLTVSFHTRISSRRPVRRIQEHGGKILHDSSNWVIAEVDVGFLPSLAQMPETKNFKNRTQYADGNSMGYRHLNALAQYEVGLLSEAEAAALVVASVDNLVSAQFYAAKDPPGQAEVIAQAIRDAGGRVGKIDTSFPDYFGGSFWAKVLVRHLRELANLPGVERIVEPDTIGP